MNVRAALYTWRPFMHVRASWLLAGVSVLLACGDIDNPVQPSRDVTRGAAAAFVPAAGFTEVQVRGSACALSATSELSCFGGSNGTPAPEAPAQPSAGAYQSFSLGAAH